MKNFFSFFISKMLVCACLYFISMQAIMAQTPSYQTNSWMGQISDNVLLGDINMLGTHNSGTSGFSGAYKCQERTISQQLEDGVRFLDIRLRSSSGVLKVAHGSSSLLNQTSSNEWTSDVLNPVKNFLAANPTETVMLLVKSEFGNDADDITLKMSVYLTMDEYSSMFYTTPSINPKLGDVRGKCVLVRRYETSGSSHNNLGLNVQQGWPVSNTTPAGTSSYLGYGIRQTTQPPYFRVEDLYDSPSWSSKQSAISNNFTAAHTSTIFCLTYISYAPITSSDPSVTNAWVLQQINANPGYVKWGIIAVDYYNNNSTLMTKVIESNFPPLTTKYVKNGGSDSNDGNSWDNAYATFSKAYSETGGNGSSIHIKGVHTISSEITLDKTVILKGYDDAVLKGGGSNRLFNVTCPELTIDGLTLQDGKQTGSGNSGAALKIAADVSVTITNCVFKNNKATDQSGGAIIANGANIVLDIKNTYFEGNECKYAGGALNINGSDGVFTFENCIMVGNKSTDGSWSNSGAIAFESGKTGTLYVVNCTLAGNTASGASASPVPAAINLSTAGKANIYNTIFHNNTGKNAANSDISFTTGTTQILAFFNNAITTSLTGVMNSGCVANATEATLFANYAAGNYLPPLTNFAGRDKGTASGFTHSATDFAGNPRVVGTINIGAYEERSTSNIQVLAGAGVSNVAKTATYSYGKTFDVTFTVDNEEFSPTPQDGVVFTSTGNNNYTASISFSKSSPITISAAEQTNICYVAPDGNDSNNGHSWNKALATLAAAYNKIPDGGQIHVKGNYSLSSPLTLAKNCTLRGYGNPVLSGGGTSRVIDVTAGTVNLYGLTIRDGKTTNSEYAGGGITVLAGATLKVYNCMIINNTTTTQYGAGGVWTKGAECYVYNSVIANNVNTYSNSGRVCGFRPEAGNSYIYNTIFWNNHMNDGSIGHINSSVSTRMQAFQNNIADTEFWNGATYLNVSGNLVVTDVSKVFADYDNNKLYPSAPLSAFAGHNLGINSGIYSTDVDIAGNQRITETTVDIGAYEGIAKPNIVAGNNVSSINLPAMDNFYSYGAVVTATMTLNNADARPVAIEGVSYTQTGANTWDAAIAITNSATITLAAESPVVWYIKTTGNDANAGHSWNEAKQTIEAALSAASEGDMVFIEGGTYTVPAAGYSIDKSISLYGGFAGTENLESERAKVSAGESYEFVNPTVITGEGVSYDTGNRHRMFTIQDVSPLSILFDGLTLTQSTTDDRSPAIYGRGALTLRDCIFRDNVAPAASSQTVGGAVAYDYAGGTLTVEGCKFENNACGQYGGGICLKDGTVNISNSEFIGNSSRNGGGVYIYPNMTATINNSVFQGNQTFYEGAAIMSHGGTLSATQCLFIANKTATKNEGYGHGEAIYSRNNGSANIYNCLFVDNTSTATGADCQSVNGKGGAAFNVYNSIFYGNKNGDAIGVNVFNNNICATIPEATTASGNNVQTNTDALFTNYAANDYTPTINSYAINRGASVGNEPTTDFAGNQRVVGLAIDMGPYEYQTVTYPVTVTTSNVALTSTLSPNAVEVPAVAFTYDANVYHAPRVLVNRVSYPITDGAEKTVSLSALGTTLTSSLDIMIAAYPLNEAPVTEDTYIYDGRQPDANNPLNTTSPYDPIHYLDKELYIRNNGASTQRHTYLKFDKTEFPAAYNSVSLRLYNKGTNIWTEGFTINVYPQKETWSGETLHGNNEPAKLSTPTVALSLPALADTVFTPDESTVKTIVLTNDLIAAGTNGNTASLRLYAPSSGNCQIRFASLENGNPDYVPTLVFALGTDIPVQVSQDEIIATRYYTLQGIEVVGLGKGNIYVRQTIMKSGKKESKVIFGK